MDRINSLFEKYQNNQCTPEEIEELLEYFKIGENEALLKTQIDLAISATIAEDAELETATDEVYSRIQSHILHDSTKQKRIIPLRWLAAASVLFIFSIGGYLYLNKPKTAQIAAIKPGTYKNDIAPGSNNAILTLGNGQQIVLKTAKNGLLTNQGNTQIQKTANGQIIYKVAAISATNSIAYNTITTKRADKYDVTLPDGTIAYLDAASSIHFPTAFSGNNRQVSITGQVYFEVAHDKSKPFRVTVRGQTVEVLGTHFNINAYDDEPGIRTTLLEGSVKISVNGQSALLHPGEQAQIGAITNKISVIKPDLDEVLAWKNGLFKFNNTDLVSVMRQLNRWYDIDIIYEGTNKNYRFGGYIPRDSKLSEVLRILNISGVKFSIDGRKLIVYQ